MNKGIVLLVEDQNEKTFIKQILTKLKMSVANNFLIPLFLNHSNDTAPEMLMITTTVKS